MISASAESASTSTSNLERRSSMPASAICSRTRTLMDARGTRNRAGRTPGASRCDEALVRLERGGTCDPALDLRAELREPELDRRQRDRDVEHVEPADVSDPEHLALQLSLPGGERDAVAV